MKHARLWSVTILLAVSLLAACGDDDNGGAAATPTVTSSPPATQSTATPTAPETPAPSTTPTPPGGAAVAALAVLHEDVPRGTGDALGLPPPGWGSEAEEDAFDRALSYAEWTLTGPVGLKGTVGADGSFEIPDLPPGEYRLELTRTLGGNLAAVSVPLRVGESGRVELVIEVAQGEVRSTVRYEDGSTEVIDTVGPNGTRVVTRDGEPVEIKGYGGAFVDADGDGVFEPVDCAESVWLCGADRDCGPDRYCGCVSSCPTCENCGPLVCLPGTVRGAYRCGEDGSCASPGDRCVCAASCPECDDCAEQVCVPGCDPVSIVALEVAGPTQLRVGREVRFVALARLDDGGTIDVSQQVIWESSDTDVLTVDSWGTAVGVSVGNAAVTARLGELGSDDFAVRVVERPELVKLYLQNLSCFAVYDRPADGAPLPKPDAEPGDILPPSCNQVVRVGGTLFFSALGEFADSTYEDLTAEVEWRLSNPEAGTVEGGRFTGVAEGTTDLRAALGAVVSEPTEIRVVTRPTVVGLSIYPDYGRVLPFGPPVDATEPGGAPDFCFDCGSGITVLLGDEVRFHASAVYDTGEWEDVTERVTWRSSVPSAAAVGADGVVEALAAGETFIDAELDGVTSPPVGVRVVEEANVVGLSIYQEGADRVVAKGGQAIFRANAYYDVGFEHDVTAEATWHRSDPLIGDFTAPGVFTGESAGTAEVWAELGGIESNRLPMKVFETSEISYCDPANVNRAEWFDGFNRVILESDCAQYTPSSGRVTLRFTVTERERPGGIFDPCLDLFVYQGPRLVRTVREEGCGQPFLPPGADFDEAAPRYQTLAFWDLRDDRGNLVAPGVYTVHGRFYLYYDPVVSLDVAVVAPNGRIACEQNPCGNGCGYVASCGDTDPPLPCPAVCVPLCECPAGWGITPEGDCEPCPLDCCPAGTTCDDGLPPCEEPRDCCWPGEFCPPPLDLCEPRCCPAGADCGPANLPPCEPKCCPAGAGCDPAIPTCPLECCPPGAPCIPELPPCETKCCPPGESCPDGTAPCPVPLP